MGIEGFSAMWPAGNRREKEGISAGCAPVSVLGCGLKEAGKPDRIQPEILKATPAALARFAGLASCTEIFRFSGGFTLRHFKGNFKASCN